MPAQKRSSLDATAAAAAAATHKQLQSDVAENVTCGGEAGESDRSLLWSHGEDKGSQFGKECVIVNLSEIRKEVQCSICLGIIRKTRTVMECLHRFCRECIDKSMRLGNKECPVCRAHCASRRSLRDDPNFDALIAALYPDIDKYEEEELTFVEEEMSRNKQIQASIGNTVCRQAEACSSKRQRKATASAKKIQNHDVQWRGKKNAAETQGSDDNKDNNGHGVIRSLLNDELTSEIRAKRFKRWIRTQSASDSDDENDLEGNRESAAASAVLVGPSDRLAWGKNGVRSNTRHGNANTSNGKSARKGRLSKLVGHLKNLEERDNELDLHIMLVPIDAKRAPSLKCPYLCCRRTLSVGHLRQHVALQTSLQSEEIEMYLVKKLNSKLEASICAGSIDPCKDHLQALGEQDTLARLGTYNFTPGHLLLGYQKKLINLKK